MRWAPKITIVAAVLLAACGGSSTPPPASAPVPASQPPSASPAETSDTDRAAEAAPDVTVTTFAGDRFSLADHRGMPVVINFFDSW